MTDRAEPKLDRIDRNILRHLQADATIRNVELSEKVNLSPAACLRRVERLREAGVIRRTVALVEPAHVDLTTLVFVGIVLDRSTAESFAAFEAAAQKIKGCLECHVVSGDMDYLLLLRTKDIAAFNRLHAGEILKLPGVRQIRTFFVLKEILSTTALPV
ncbi:MAG TPA: Lrp/AsnC ligand binding domain-containing protein [Xanthobacteraceae bacterium]|nr:Lrp/AsnC ligand binding domain-containing protein [Xanthobacteraceae bacterium]